MDGALTVGEVARQFGVAVTTLRSWHQRYGLGPTAHAPGRHRRYGPDDLDRLRRMLLLTGAGVPPAEAARRIVAGPAAEREARHGGGYPVPLGRGAAPARGLARAAMRLDAGTVRGLLDDALRAHGVVPAWQDMIAPVLVALGERHTGTAHLIAVEHLLSNCVTAALGQLPRPATGPVPVLLACAPGELHSLPIEVLAAALAERAVASRMLGAQVPLPALHAAVRRVGPRAVGVWSQVPATAAAADLLSLTQLDAPPALLAALGPGWELTDLPARVHRPGSLSEAIELLTVTG